MKNDLRRRSALLVALGLAAVIGSGPSCQSSGGPEPGGVTPQESFERVVTALMTKWNIPGGAVALARDGVPVMTAAYGTADKAASSPVTDDSLFRIASLSKPVTAAAILKLREAGLVDLGARVFDILDDVVPPEGSTPDHRLAAVTVLDLLRHSGGWDRALSFDPMFRSREIAAAFGVDPPADAAAIVRYMAGQPLDWDPATKYAYSNFGYCLLGRIVEKATGQAYDEYVKAAVLTPAGAAGMRLGRSLEADRAAGEVAYYDYSGAPLAESVFPTGPDEVPWPYGGFAIEPMDAHGGWLASARDLLRFVLAVDGRTATPDVLQPASIALMVERPPLAEYSGAATFYALGWQVRPTGGDANWWHTGSLPGTATILVRTANALSWVALFNSRPADSDSFFNELDSALWRAVNGITDWN